MSGGDCSMSLIVRNLCVGFSAVVACMLWLGAAFAEPGGCSLDRSGSQDVLRCPDGLTIVVEKGARYSLADRNSDGHVDGVRLNGKALLLDLPRRENPTRLEVITPQAIAAVRGTQWAVDVEDGKTSVFVVRGRVEVRRPARSAAVNLGPGQGVDVEAGGGALVVKRWPAKRVTALMARFGR
jgi:ferric-dicitrate binding protein FerR (iron transport regulator)